MKHILLLLVCMLSLSVNAQNAASAQPAATATATQNATISGEQWNHIMAMLARGKAHSVGVRNSTVLSKWPADYDLEYLDKQFRPNDVHHLWPKIYDYFKGQLNKSGTIDDILRIAKGNRPNDYTNPLPDIQAYLAKSAPATQAQQPAAQTAQAEETDTAAEEAAVAENPAQPEQEQERATGDLNLQLIINIILALMALAALVLSYINYKASQVAETRLDKHKERIQKMKDQIAILRSENERLENIVQQSTAAAATVKAKAAPAAAQQQAAKPAEKPKPAPAQPKTYYVSRPSAAGEWNRASANYQPGNSIFEITSTDGVNGTFKVIDNVDVHTSALMMPTENLAPVCEGDSISNSAGMSRVVTDAPGKVTFASGTWRVTVKARVHYER